MGYRNELKQQFITNCELGSYHTTPIKQDASPREYTRLSLDHAKYILMDSPPEACPINPFVKVTNFLLSNEFSAPEIFVTDDENGFLLIEDLGEMSFNRYLQTHHDMQDKLYFLAIDVLVKISDIKVADLDFPKHNKETLLDGFRLFQKYHLKNNDPKFIELCSSLLDQLDYEYKYFALRDYHADNLMVLPERKGVNQIGILDYQDASLGFLSYDLLSLIQDARRFISFSDQEKFYNHFTDQFDDLDLNKFKKEYDILSFQRNARILGLFKKFAEEGRIDYLKYLENVEQYFKQNLESEHLPELKAYLSYPPLA